MPKGVVYPFGGEPIANGLRDASIPGTHDKDIKGWMVYATNLVQALPESDKTIQAMAALDALIVVDMLPSEIVGWADIVLPEATYLERYDDLFAPPFRQPFVALRQPVIPPMYQTKPGWWIAKQVAERLGLGAFYPFEDVEDYLAQRAQAAGLDIVELARTGVALGKKEPTTIEEGAVPAFDTPSGKIELKSSLLEEAGLSAFPEYTAPEEPGPDQFRLLSGRAAVHTFGRTTNNRELSEVTAENRVWLNTRRATELGIGDGETVVLVNQDGVRSDPVKVEVTQRIRPDCVYLVHGYGHDAKGLRFARGRGASDTRLLSRVKIDPVMGGTGMNVNFVRVERSIA